MSDTSALDRLLTAKPPTAADSDLIGIAIIRLQRAVERMQEMQYDEETWAHMEKAAEFLGWVASNWRRRNTEAAVSSDTTQDDGGEKP